jgi:son of sevenless-like protein
MEKTFMMTWKSFTTIDTLIEGLAQRFRILPPDNLKPNELEEWKKKKQALIHARYALTPSGR